MNRYNLANAMSNFNKKHITDSNNERELEKYHFKMEENARRFIQTQPLKPLTKEVREKFEKAVNDIKYHGDEARMYRTFAKLDKDIDVHIRNKLQNGDNMDDITYNCGEDDACIKYANSRGYKYVVNKECRDYDCKSTYDAVVLTDLMK